MIDREALKKAENAYRQKYKEFFPGSWPDAETCTAMATATINAYLTSAGEGAVPVGYMRPEDVGKLSFWVSCQESSYYRKPVYAAAPTPTRQDGAREEETTRRLRDLLAVIHRDGGHYLDEHGLEKACFDAIEKVIGWLSIEDTTPPAPDEAVEAEREACAQIAHNEVLRCQTESKRYRATSVGGTGALCMEIGGGASATVIEARIRARSRRDGGGGVR